MNKTLLIIGLLFVSIAVSAKEWKDLSNKEKEEFANHLNLKELQIEPNNEDVINLSEDKIPVDKLLTHVWDFSQAEEAMWKVKNGEVIKGLVKIEQTEEK